MQPNLYINRPTVELSQSNSQRMQQKAVAIHTQSGGEGNNVLEWNKILKKKDSVDCTIQKAGNSLYDCMKCQEYFKLGLEE